MHDNAELVRKVEKYLKHEPDGLLGLELKTLDVIFKDQAKRKWFDETLQQTLQLWEVNLRWLWTSLVNQSKSIVFQRH